MKRDPREIVNEDESNVLARPQLTMPVDLVSINEQLEKLHHDVREDSSEEQSRFDRTLIYLSSGAIVLTYSFFSTAQGKIAIVSLVSAVCSWAVTCVVSLCRELLRAKKSVKIINNVGQVILNTKACQFWVGNLKELDKCVKLSDNGYLGFNDLKGKTEEEMKAEFRDGIAKIHNELREKELELKNISDELYNTYESETLANILHLLIFVTGCVAFAVFTYMTYLKGVL